MLVAMDTYEKPLQSTRRFTSERCQLPDAAEGVQGGLGSAGMNGMGRPHQHMMVEYVVCLVCYRSSVSFVTLSVLPEVTIL